MSNFHRQSTRQRDANCREDRITLRDGNQKRRKTLFLCFSGNRSHLPKLLRKKKWFTAKLLAVLLICMRLLSGKHSIKFRFEYARKKYVQEVPKSSKWRSPTIFYFGSVT